MLPVIQQNWPIILAVLAALLLAAWLLSRARPDRRERHYAPDALDPGAAPAQRNQAYIDAPSAAAAVITPPVAPPPDVAAVAGMDAAEELASATAPTATIPGDDLTRIKGIGAKLSARLAELGVVSFAQIAAWSEADLARIDPLLGPFAGRPARDNWIEQCRYLAAEDVAGYEATFGKL